MSAQHTPGMPADQRPICGEQAECARCGSSVPGNAGHFAVCEDCNAEIGDE